MTEYAMNTVGLSLILLAAFLLLLVTLYLVRYAPRLAWPALIVTLAAGSVGFLLICIADPQPMNIVLGILFVIVSVRHGTRLRRRVRSGDVRANDTTESS